jgi:hypothetical protein
MRIYEEWRSRSLKFFPTFLSSEKLAKKYYQFIANNRNELAITILIQELTNFKKPLNLSYIIDTFQYQLIDPYKNKLNLDSDKISMLSENDFIIDILYLGRFNIMEISSELNMDNSFIQRAKLVYLNKIMAQNRTVKINTLTKMAQNAVLDDTLTNLTNSIVLRFFLETVCLSSTNSSLVSDINYIVNSYPPLSDLISKFLVYRSLQDSMAKKEFLCAHFLHQCASDSNIDELKNKLIAIGLGQFALTVTGE